MNTHTEQDIIDLAANLKTYRIGAQNAAVAKGYDASYFNTSTTKLVDIPDNLLKYYPGKKDIWGEQPVFYMDLYTETKEIDITLINRASDISINAVDNAVSFSPNSVSYSDASVLVHIVYPETHTPLPAAPKGYRVQVRTSDGFRKYIWVYDGTTS